MLKRKIDTYLDEWRKTPDHKPLIVKGARQIGKTESIRLFGRTHYANVVEINFALQKAYKGIFDDGYEVDSILKNITLLNPEVKIKAGDTLFFFDELQECPDCATSLKAFKMDGRFDVICSGSLMGVYYKQIESNSVGYKEDYEMFSLDFEEYLWAIGYDNERIEDMFRHMKDVVPFSQIELDTYFSHFQDYMILGGMPEVVATFVRNKNFTNILKTQKQLLLDYEEDITKYASGFDQARILSVYRHISTFIGKENKKFQVTKIAHGARNREYVGAVEWLNNAGIINVCYCLESPELPLKGNYDPKQYKIYYRDTGMLIASLDDEAQEDLRVNKNFSTYKGGIYENIVGDMLKKQCCDLYFYRNDKIGVEMDFFVRDADSLVPIEVKANDNATVSLNKMTSGNSEMFADIKYGIKFCRKNIGFNDKFYTFPYFLTFLTRRFLKNR